jgi:CRP-like cAMP-binding protein
MEAGTGFGEIALMANSKKGAKRHATIKCDEDVHVAILEKDDFTKVIKSSMDKKIDEQIAFLKNFRFADGISRGTFVKLLYCFKERTLRRRDVIYKENDIADGVYFIKEGEFEVNLFD